MSEDKSTMEQMVKDVLKETNGVSNFQVGILSFVPTYKWAIEFTLLDGQKIASEIDIPPGEPIEAAKPTLEKRIPEMLKDYLK